MNATLTITPDANIDEIERKVIDLNKVQRIEKTWEDIVVVFNAKNNKHDTIQISKISLYDHRLIIEDVQYRILHMYSKS